MEGFASRSAGFLPNPGQVRGDHARIGPREAIVLNHIECQMITREPKAAGGTFIPTPFPRTSGGSYSKARGNLRNRGGENVRKCNFSESVLVLCPVPVPGWRIGNESAFFCPFERRQDSLLPVKTSPKPFDRRTAPQKPSELAGPTAVPDSDLERSSSSRRNGPVAEHRHQPDSAKRPIVDSHRPLPRRDNSFLTFGWVYAYR